MTTVVRILDNSLEKGFLNKKEDYVLISAFAGGITLSDMENKSEAKPSLI